MINTMITAMEITGARGKLFLAFRCNIPVVILTLLSMASLYADDETSCFSCLMTSFENHFFLRCYLLL